LLSTLVETSNGGLVPFGQLMTDPEVAAVITTDLLDPRRYLSGGELVLTGLAWWRPDRPDRSRAFVAALVGGGVVALACGEAEFGSVPEDLVVACAEAGLPLLRVPIAYSFAAVTERANRQLSGRDDLVAVLARHRALVTAAAARKAGGSGLSGILELVGADLDLRCWVLSPAGRLVAGVEPVPDEGERKLLARRFLRAPRLPCSVVRPGVRTVSIFLAERASTGARAASWLLAVDQDQGGWRQTRRRVVEELASLVAVELDLAGRRSDVEHQLASALTRDSADEVASAARRCGLDPSVAAVVIAGTGPLAGTVVAEALVDHSATWSLGEVGYEVLAVLSVDDPDRVVDRLRAVVERLAPGLGEDPLRLGVSDAVTGAAGLLGAVAEARAAATAGSPAVRHTVAGPDRLSSHALLLAAVPAELRRAYRDRVLGPLLKHDKAHRSDLVRTLEAYLECSGSWSRCAARMHLHVNTLRYRIQRIEALTGRDLRRLEDQADLLMALRVP
jgi:PucR C-terminal helix-turn-helix domain/Purine catabolism regulatory protein-like family/GGDEF-like domain